MVPQAQHEPPDGRIPHQRQGPPIPQGDRPIEFSLVKPTLAVLESLFEEPEKDRSRLISGKFDDYHRFFKAVMKKPEGGFQEAGEPEDIVKLRRETAKRFTQILNGDLREVVNPKELPKVYEGIREMGELGLDHGNTGGDEEVSRIIGEGLAALASPMTSEYDDAKLRTQTYVDLFKIGMSTSDSETRQIAVKSVRKLLRGPYVPKNLREVDKEEAMGRGIGKSIRETVGKVVRSLKGIQPTDPQIQALREVFSESISHPDPSVKEIAGENLKELARFAYSDTRFPELYLELFRKTLEPEHKFSLATTCDNMDVMKDFITGIVGTLRGDIAVIRSQDNPNRWNVSGQDESGRARNLVLQYNPEEDSLSILRYRLKKKEEKRRKRKLLSFRKKGEETTETADEYELEPLSFNRKLTAIRDSEDPRTKTSIPEKINVYEYPNVRAETQTAESLRFLTVRKTEEELDAAHIKSIKTIQPKTHNIPYDQFIEAFLIGIRHPNPEVRRITKDALKALGVKDVGSEDPIAHARALERLRREIVGMDNSS
ncbi:MAG: hypothetical protein ABH950_03670 [Candidatus Altiarchaeota archaeon]